MTEVNFKKQIEEDIREYQNQFNYIPNIQKPEWAFNFWVLDKLYSEDEEVIVDRIVDYNDKGIDCFVWHEEQMDLYLIQNKYFGEGTRLTLDYIQNDFLTRAVTVLSNGTYTRSVELQNIYTQFSGQPNFSINLVLYVTNDGCKTPEIMRAIETFNRTHLHQNATIYGLKEIEGLYYKEPIVAKKTMSFQIQTLNKGTMLSVNTAAYKLTQAIDARYIMAPVYNLYQMFKKSEQEGYPIFDSNIREYLGSAGTVNKRIRDTLKDPDDRKNFFYYNNGITIIVKSMRDMGVSGKFRSIEIQDPQIVNGCQTVSTISEVFSGWPIDSIEEDFKNTFVMLKVLVIPDNSSSMTALRKNIVTYNNSQNSIDQKTFEASSDEFRRLQLEFRRKGLLICIKQSDKYRYTKVEFKTANELMGLNNDLMKKFDMSHLRNTKDFLISLEKLLQVVLAFVSTPRDATQKKSKLLVTGSEQNKLVVDFIHRNDVTINDLIALWMLYIRADYEKREGDGRMPIPLYIIHCFSRYECEGDPSKISTQLSDKQEITRLINLYKMTFTGYFNVWSTNNPGLGYNDMIKNPIDYSKMDQSRQMALAMFPKV